ncbi:hypothetical protein FRB95_014818 [Tulasnella sp. JGI-2019a]|nr:hypothetical protein FRB95_014818 [Tulasnella sp. JGI-2019a]
MSDFSGPGAYMLFPLHAAGQCLDVSRRSTASGTKVILHSPNGPGLEHQLWEIVGAGGNAGDSEVGDNQYHLLAAHSGRMLCAPENGLPGTCMTASRSIRHSSTRWKIAPAGKGAFYIMSVGGANLALAIDQGKKNPGSDLVVTTKVEAAHFQFELKLPNF